MKKPKARDGSGMAIGIAIGVALGVALDNIAVGIALGVAIGAALVSAGRDDANKQDPDDRADDGTDEDDSA